MEDDRPQSLVNYPKCVKTCKKRKCKLCVPDKKYHVNFDKKCLDCQISWAKLSNKNINNKSRIRDNNLKYVTSNACKSRHCHSSRMLYKINRGRTRSKANVKGKFKKFNFNNVIERIKKFASVFKKRNLKFNSIKYKKQGKSLKNFEDENYNCEFDETVTESILDVIANKRYCFNESETVRNLETSELDTKYYNYNEAKKENILDETAKRRYYRSFNEAECKRGEKVFASQEIYEDNSASILDELNNTASRFSASNRVYSSIKYVIKPKRTLNENEADSDCCSSNENEHESDWEDVLSESYENCSNNEVETDIDNGKYSFYSKLVYEENSGSTQPKRRSKGKENIRNYYAVDEELENEIFSFQSQLIYEESSKSTDSNLTVSMENGSIKKFTFTMPTVVALAQQTSLSTVRKRNVKQRKQFKGSVRNKHNALQRNSSRNRGINGEGQCPSPHPPMSSTRAIRVKQSSSKDDKRTTSLIQRCKNKEEITEKEVCQIEPKTKRQRRSSKKCCKRKETSDKDCEEKKARRSSRKCCKKKKTSEKDCEEKESRRSSRKCCKRKETSDKDCEEEKARRSSKKCCKKRKTSEKDCEEKESRRSSKKCCKTREKNREKKEKKSKREKKEKVKKEKQRRTRSPKKLPRRAQRRKRTKGRDIFRSRSSVKYKKQEKQEEVEEAPSSFTQRDSPEQPTCHAREESIEVEETRIDEETEVKPKEKEEDKKKDRKKKRKKKKKTEIWQPCSEIESNKTGRIIVLNPHQVEKPFCKVKLTGKDYKGTFNLSLDPAVDSLLYCTLKELKECNSLMRDPTQDKEAAYARAEASVKHCYKTLESAFRYSVICDGRKKSIWPCPQNITASKCLDKYKIKNINVPKSKCSKCKFITSTFSKFRCRKKKSLIKPTIKSSETQTARKIPRTNPPEIDITDSESCFMEEYNEQVFTPKNHQDCTCCKCGQKEMECKSEKESLAESAVTEDVITECDGMETEVAESLGTRSFAAESGAGDVAGCFAGSYLSQKLNCVERVKTAIAKSECRGLFKEATVRFNDTKTEGYKLLNTLYKSPLIETLKYTRSKLGGKLHKPFKGHTKDTSLHHQNAGLTYNRKPYGEKCFCPKRPGKRGISQFITNDTQYDHSEIVLNRIHGKKVSLIKQRYEPSIESYVRNRFAQKMPKKRDSLTRPKNDIKIDEKIRLISPYNVKNVVKTETEGGKSIAEMLLDNGQMITVTFDSKVSQNDTIVKPKETRSFERRKPYFIRRYSYDYDSINKSLCNNENCPGCEKCLEYFPTKSCDGRSINEQTIQTFSVISCDYNNSKVLSVEPSDYKKITSIRNQNTNGCSKSYNSILIRKEKSIRCKKKKSKCTVSKTYSCIQRNKLNSLCEGLNKIRTFQDKQIKRMTGIIESCTNICKKYVINEDAFKKQPTTTTNIESTKKNVFSSTLFINENISDIMKNNETTNTVKSNTFKTTFVKPDPFNDNNNSEQKARENFNKFFKKTHSREENVLNTVVKSNFINTSSSPNDGINLKSNETVVKTVKGVQLELNETDEHIGVERPRKWADPYVLRFPICNENFPRRNEADSNLVVSLENGSVGKLTFTMPAIVVGHIHDVALENSSNNNISHHHLKGSSKSNKKNCENAKCCSENSCQIIGYIPTCKSKQKTKVKGGMLSKEKKFGSSKIYVRKSFDPDEFEPKELERFCVYFQSEGECKENKSLKREKGKENKSPKREKGKKSKSSEREKGKKSKSSERKKGKKCIFSKRKKSEKCKSPELEKCEENKPPECDKDKNRESPVLKNSKESKSNKPNKRKKNISFEPEINNEIECPKPEKYNNNKSLKSKRNKKNISSETENYYSESECLPFDAGVTSSDKNCEVSKTKRQKKNKSTKDSSRKTSRNRRKCNGLSTTVSTASECTSEPESTRASSCTSRKSSKSFSESSSSSRKSSKSCSKSSRASKNSSKSSCTSRKSSKSSRASRKSSKSSCTSRKSSKSSRASRKSSKSSRSSRKSSKSSCTSRKSSKSSRASRKSSKSSRASRKSSKSSRSSRKSGKSRCSSRKSSKSRKCSKICSEPTTLKDLDAVLNSNGLTEPCCNVEIFGQSYQGIFNIALDPEIDRIIYCTLKELNKCNMDMKKQSKGSEAANEHAEAIVKHCYTVLDSLFKSSLICNRACCYRNNQIYVDPEKTIVSKPQKCSKIKVTATQTDKKDTKCRHEKRKKKVSKRGKSSCSKPRGKKQVCNRACCCKDNEIASKPKKSCKKKDCITQTDQYKTKSEKRRRKPVSEEEMDSCSKTGVSTFSKGKHEKPVSKQKSNFFSELKNIKLNSKCCQTSESKQKAKVDRQCKLNLPIKEATYCVMGAGDVVTEAGGLARDAGTYLYQKLNTAYSKSECAGRIKKAIVKCEKEAKNRIKQARTELRKLYKGPLMKQLKETHSKYSFRKQCTKRKVENLEQQSRCKDELNLREMKVCERDTCKKADFYLQKANAKTDITIDFPQRVRVISPHKASTFVKTKTHKGEDIAEVFLDNGQVISVAQEPNLLPCTNNTKTKQEVDKSDCGLQAYLVQNNALSIDRIRSIYSENYTEIHDSKPFSENLTILRAGDSSKIDLNKRKVFSSTTVTRRISDTFNVSKTKTFVTPDPFNSTRSCEQKARENFNKLFQKNDVQPLVNLFFDPEDNVSDAIVTKKFIRNNLPPTNSIKLKSNDMPDELKAIESGHNERWHKKWADANLARFPLNNGITYDYKSEQTLQKPPDDHKTFIPVIKRYYQTKANANYENSINKFDGNSKQVLPNSDTVAEITDTNKFFQDTSQNFITLTSGTESSNTFQNDQMSSYLT